MILETNQLVQHGSPKSVLVVKQTFFDHSTLMANHFGTSWEFRDIMYFITNVGMDWKEEIG